ncbi:MAG: hypothetical protein FWF03_03595 [Defluviitaleaceae bacterium]|nr:hypothetical protein [Defluviitaleaceae bacterium]
MIGRSLYNPAFSHIYVEKGARDYPLTGEIIGRFPRSELIEINHYKDVFNRPRQDFNTQIMSRNLILAVRNGAFFYEGSEICRPGRFYKSAQIINCIYGCDYCYLRGAYESGNVVAFVNSNDYFNAASAIVKGGANALFCLSYETDLLAADEIFRFTSGWVEFARRTPAAFFEIRTKTGRADILKKHEPVENMLIEWSFAAGHKDCFNENGTPGEDARIAAIYDAIGVGWNAAICIEPVVLGGNWKNDVKTLIDKVEKAFGVKKLKKISAGGLRIPTVYYKRLVKTCVDPLPYARLEENGGVRSYGPEAETMIKKTVGELAGIECA